MTALRLYVHNQGDKAQTPTSGWDVACLTERSPGRTKGRERHTSRLLKGLAIEWDPDVLAVTKRGARLAHVGLAKVTPNRGTLYIAGTHLPSGRKVAFVCSHRINDPHGRIRALPPLRKVLWNTHARLDRALIRRLERKGYLVFYGGDINERTAGLGSLKRLLKGRYDAIGYPKSTAVHHEGTETGSRRRSDHPSYTATFVIESRRSK